MTSFARNDTHKNDLSPQKEEDVIKRTKYFKISIRKHKNKTF